MEFYRQMIKKLENGENFKFSRWGDGEFGCMVGWEGKNRDGNTYLPELRKSLLKILGSQPKYYMGLQYGVIYNPQLRIPALKKLFELTAIKWVYGDVLHVASEFRLLKEFIDALKCRNIVVIGAEYYHKLVKKLDGSHIVISNNNSFSEFIVVRNFHFLALRILLQTSNRFKSSAKS